MTDEVSPLIKVLSAFGIEPVSAPSTFGSGHINNTYFIEGVAEKKYVLQKINIQVFNKPWAIARNIKRASEYLAEHHPTYHFITPLSTLEGSELFEKNNEYWRLTPFVPNSISIDQATTPAQTYEAARQFGLLARNLDGLDMGPFEATIPGFHNLTGRYRQFREALNGAERGRKDNSQELIDAFLLKNDIVEKYENLLQNPDFPNRLMHHDTKINNVLLDTTTQRGICVCDLDTLMPGKVISDIGDMIRTGVSPVSEESTEFELVEVRLGYYKALIEGYLSEMKHVLTPTEKENIIFSGPFLVYMQGLRFLTDYLNGDVYYPIKYPEHNLNRARNQMVLLDDLYDKHETLQQIIDEAIA
jgi:hypothetical protein